MYVVDEANIESHGIGFEPKDTLANREDYEKAHMMRVVGMFERDKNHASIIIWSLGNEAGNGINFHRCYAWLKRNDVTRPVQYENARIQPIWSQEEIETLDEDTDIYVPMYKAILITLSSLSFFSTHIYFFKKKRKINSLCVIIFPASLYGIYFLHIYVWIIFLPHSSFLCGYIYIYL